MEALINVNAQIPTHFLPSKQVTYINCGIFDKLDPLNKAAIGHRLRRSTQANLVVGIDPVACFP